MKLILICLFLIGLCITPMLYADTRTDVLEAIAHDEQVVKNLQTFIEKNPTVVGEYKADLEVLTEEILSFFDSLRITIETNQPEGELRAYYQLSVITMSFIINIASECGLTYENDVWHPIKEEDKQRKEENIRKEAEELLKL